MRSFTLVCLLLMVGLLGAVYLPVLGETGNTAVGKEAPPQKENRNAVAQTQKKGAEQIKQGGKVIHHHHRHHVGTHHKKCPCKHHARTAASILSSEKKGLVERILFIGNAEGPANGSGQLNCRGFNRSIALPDRLIHRYAVPDSIYALDPGNQQGPRYGYVSPLATIEPTAIRLGLPINTQFGFTQTDALKNELLLPEHESDQIWVSWERKSLMELERAVLTALGINADLAVKWDATQFDRVDVLEITRNDKGAIQVAYRKELEGMGKFPKECAVLVNR